MWTQGSCSKNKKENKPSKLIWSDEIGEMLSQRNIEIAEENGKETERSENKPIMDYAFQCVEEKNYSKMISPPMNQTRLRKRNASV